MTIHEQEPREKLGKWSEKIGNWKKRIVRVACAGVALWVFDLIPDGDYGREYQEFGNNPCSEAYVYLPDNADDLEFTVAQNFKPGLVFDKTEPAGVEEFGATFQVTPHLYEQDIVVFVINFSSKIDYGTTAYGVNIPEISIFGFTVFKESSISPPPTIIKMIGALDPHKGDNEPLVFLLKKVKTENLVTKWVISKVRIKQHERWKSIDPKNLMCDGTHPVFWVAKGKHTFRISDKECATSLGNEDNGKYPFFSEQCDGIVVTELQLKPEYNVGERNNQNNPFENSDLKDKFPGEDAWSDHFCGGLGNGDEKCRGKLYWYPNGNVK